MFFFFNDTATTEIYTLSLHDALPICLGGRRGLDAAVGAELGPRVAVAERSEEHTSELQSLRHLVCRLLLEKKNKQPSRQHQPRLWLPIAGSAGVAPPRVKFQYDLVLE